MIDAKKRMASANQENAKSDDVNPLCHIKGKTVRAAGGTQTDIGQTPLTKRIDNLEANMNKMLRKLEQFDPRLGENVKLTQVTQSTPVVMTGGVSSHSTTQRDRRILSRVHAKRIMSLVTDAEGSDTYLDNALTLLLICRRSETLQM